MPVQFEIDEDDIILPSRPVYDLLPHQARALEFISKRETDLQTDICGGLLGMDMGLGKTFTMLSQVVADANPVAPTLVVCPRTAIFTWQTEIKKFFGDQLRVYIYRKDTSNNIHTLTKEQLLSYDVVITNYDYVRTLATHFNFYSRVNYNGGANCAQAPVCKETTGERLLFSICWNRIIADESHNFSNYKSALWKGMISLCGVKKWCLSGTPIRNYVDDLYGQFKFLGYQDPYFDVKTFKVFGVDQYMFYMTYEKANVKLPPSKHLQIECPFDERQSQIYEYYINKTDKEFNNFTIGSSNFARVLTLFLRLRQVCVAPYIITPQSERGNDKKKKTQKDMELYRKAQEKLDEHTDGLATWVNDSNGSSGLQSSKINKTLDIIKSVPAGEKIVVFTMFNRAIDLLIKGLKTRNIEKRHVMIDGSVVGFNRTNALNIFKQGNADILFITYKVGAESLNLTEANHLVLIEPWWSPAVINQARARIHRMGQTKPVTIYELFIPNRGPVKSIEEAIIEICTNKMFEAEEFLKTGKKEKGERKLDKSTMKELLNTVKGYGR